MTASLLERLTQLDTLTPSEKLLAHFFEQRHTHLVLENLTGISEKVGVSKSTVTRFVIRLGYADFHAFKRAMKQEAASSLDSPLNRYTRKGAKQARKNIQPAHHLTIVQENLKQTIAQIRQEEFEQIVSLLSDEKKHLYLIGAATAEPIVTYFSLLLRYLRGNMTLLDGNAPTIAHRVEHIDENTVLFVMAFNRYPQLSKSMMEYFYQKGASVILLTDRHTSPMLSCANYKLVVHAEGPEMFKTRSSAIAVLEAILFELAPRFESQIPQRYNEKTDLMRHLNIYINE